MKRLAGFNVDGVPSTDPATLAHLAAENYLEAGEPIVMHGDSGTGKTHLPSDSAWPPANRAEGSAT